MDVAHIRSVRKSNMPTLKQCKRFKRLLSPSERWMYRLATILLLFGIFAGGWQVTDRYRLEQPAVGGRYEEAVVGSPQLINPLFASLNDVDLDITRLVYSGLMRYDDEQRLVADLALPDPDISADQKTYTFKLRKDAVWHDGEPFTARDVVYTYEMVQDPQVNSPLRVTFQGIQVEAIDDYTVQFTLAEPFAPFLSSLTLGILPEHIWGNFPPSQLRSVQQNLEPIGTGPFMHDTLVKDPTGFITEYRMTRFVNYYRRPAYIETVVLSFFADYEQGSPSAIEALQQQQVDGLHFVPSMLRSQAARKHVALRTLELPQYSALFFNSDRQIALRDDAVREALELAIDKDRIVRESLDNEGRVLNGPILPGFPGYEEGDDHRQQLDVANELLDEEWGEVSAAEFREVQRRELVAQRIEVLTAAALDALSASTTTSSSTSTTEQSINTSTIQAQAEQEADIQLDRELNPAQLKYRQNEDGDILELRLVTADTNEYQQAAQRIAGFWQELGIRTNIEYVHPRDISREALKDRDYDVLLYGIIIGSDPDQYPFWHSSQIEFPGLNLSQYDNETVDELLVEAREATSTQTIATLYREFQTQIQADRPAIFLYTPTYTYAVSTKIQGITGERIFTPADRFASIADWYIRTKSVWQFN